MLECAAELLDIVAGFCFEVARDASVDVAPRRVRDAAGDGLADEVVGDADKAAGPMDEAPFGQFAEAVGNLPLILTCESCQLSRCYWAAGNREHADEVGRLLPETLRSPGDEVARAARSVAGCAEGLDPERRSTSSRPDGGGIGGRKVRSQGLGQGNPIVVGDRPELDDSKAIRRQEALEGRLERCDW
jgi:hypothetical protein